MSALTDYFSSLANKIRSKVGGVQTYTPLQMVSAIDDVYDAGAASVPAPTSITPSDANPVALTANTAVKPTTAGYAIASAPTSITPSTNMPSLTAGNIYKPTANGYAVSAYTALTPSDSNPPALTGGTVYRTTNGSSGYAYATQQASKVASGTVTGTSADFSVTCGFKPKYVSVLRQGQATHMLYDANRSTTQYLQTATWQNLNAGNLYRIVSIDSNGFTINMPSSYGTWNWFAAAD